MQEGVGRGDAHHAGDLGRRGLGGGSSLLQRCFDLLGLLDQQAAQLGELVAGA